MRKKSFLSLMVVGLLISGNVWANYFTPEIEAKPAPEIIEEPLVADGLVFDVIAEDNISSAPNKAPMIEEGDVAKIGETRYATLADAIAAANALEEGGAVIEVLQNTTFTHATITKDMTIDLKNYEVTITPDFPNIFTIKANLTIRGYENGVQGKINADFTSVPYSGANYIAQLFVVNADGSLIIESGYMYGCSRAVYAKESVSIGEHATLNGKSIDLYVAAADIHVTTNGTQSSLYIDDQFGAQYTINGTLTLGGGTLCPAAKTQFSDANLAEGMSFIKTLSSGSDMYLIGDSNSMAASVGEYMFTSLPTACANSSEANPAKMLKDYSTTSYFYPANSYWLDLNGHTMSVQFVPIFGNVTIMDNNSGHTGKIVNNSTSCTIYFFKDGASFTLLGGTIKAGNGAYAIYPNNESYVCTTTISGPYAKVEADGYGVTMYGKNPSSSVTVTDGATIIGNPCLGNLGTYTDMNTTMTISNGAKLISEGLAIYHPGGGYLNISGDETVIEGGSSAIEIRAGELNMTGGKVICTGDEIEVTPNGSGQTTIGGGIVASQHTTHEPIIVNISGGEVSGPFALVQLNPQNNTEEQYKKMKVNVTGGNFMSTHTTGGTLYENVPAYGGTVTYAADAMCISQNKRIFLMGGYYNYNPVEFVAMGYKSYKLADIPESARTPEDNAAMANGYAYKIGEIDQAGEQETTVHDGDWKTEATTVWEKGEQTGTEPTAETPVVIENDKQVVVTTPATAYSVTLGEGTSKLTVKETGRLMVGAGGVNGTTDQSFIVEDGGQMAISPAQAEYQPEATVTFVADWARRKVSADSKEQGTLVAEDLYWQHIATPLSDGNQPNPSVQGVSYVNTWNLVNGWTSATWANVITPFVGYQVSSINKSTDEKITYTFKGQLVGNHADPMKFARIGFSFFGNSYLAPIDIRELLTCLESKGAIDPTVLLYDSENGVYESINRASYYIPGTKAEIQPMQGFFVFAESATNVDFDYRKAVWDAFCAKANSGVTGPATAPKMQENPFSAIACIDVQAENGAKDRVMLFEGNELSAAEDKGYDAHKMMTSGMNIYAKGSYADLAILATDNLLGSELILKTDANTNYTIRFANIKGEYALYDALTGSTINMTEGATYGFEAQANATITDRFYVVEAAKAPTQIDNVDAKAGSCKFMKNGIMFIERNNKVYNAQGQIVK